MLKNESLFQNFVLNYEVLENNPSSFMHWSPVASHAHFRYQGLDEICTSLNYSLHMHTLPVLDFRPHSFPIAWLLLKIQLQYLQTNSKQRQHWSKSIMQIFEVHFDQDIISQLLKNSFAVRNISEQTVING